MSINDNEGQVTTELEDREPEITEVEKLRSLAISQAAASAVRGIFRDEQAVADMLEERLTFDSASCSIKGLDGRSVTEHTEELYGYATHKGAKLPEPKHQTAEEKVELTILCKADLKTPDEKSAYITRWGFAKYEALALNLPRGDGQILSKADLVTPAAKSAWIAANPGKFEGLPLRRS